MAIDLLTYEFLKRYVEGANMGANANPKGKWNSAATYNTGDYVTYKNEVYIVPTDTNGNNQENVNATPGTDEKIWDKIAGINAIAETKIDDLISEIQPLCVEVANSVYNEEEGFMYLYLDDSYDFEAALEEKSYVVEKENTNWVYDEDGGLKINLIFTFLRENASKPGSFSIWSAQSYKVYLKNDNHKDPTDPNKDLTCDCLYFDRISKISLLSTAPQKGDLILLSDGLYGNKEFVLPGFNYISVNEGYKTKALLANHSEGVATEAIGFGAHSEGYRAKAVGRSSHGEGESCIALGLGSHAEGEDTQSQGRASHAEGRKSIAIGYCSHAEGYNTLAYSDQSHAEGTSTIVKCPNSHVEGYKAEIAPKAYKVEQINYNANTQTTKLIVKEGADNLQETLTNEGLLEYNSQNKTYIVPANKNVNVTIYTGVKDDNPIAPKRTSKSMLGLDTDKGILISGDVTSVYPVDSQILIDGGAIGTNNFELTGLPLTAHAEGLGTKAYILGHAEGQMSEARGLASHAEGDECIAHGEYSHAEGRESKAFGAISHVEGNHTVAYGGSSHAEGNNTQSLGTYSHAEGTSTIAEGLTAHAEGNYTRAYGDNSHAEGYASEVSKQANSGHAEGYYSKVFGNYSHAEGTSTTAYGASSHTEGNYTTTQDKYESKTYTGNYAHAEGNFSKALGNGSHAEGNNTIALGDYSHAEGSGTKAIQPGDHAEGVDTTANSGTNSSGASFAGAHAGGAKTNALAAHSFVHGYDSTVNHIQSIALGVGLQSTRANQTLFGLYNDTTNKGLFVIGNGSTDKPSNAMTVDASGGAWFAGNITFNYNGTTYNLGQIVDALKSLGELQQ